MSVYQSAPALEQAAITAKDFNFWYGDFHALTGLDLNIAKNAITSFIGPSGCGKSTFLRCINRMNDLIPDTRLEGKIFIDGRDIYSKGEKVDTLRKNVGMVFQKPNPFPKTIFENVAYGLRVNGIKDNGYIEETVVKSLKQVVLWDEQGQAERFGFRSFRRPAATPLYRTGIGHLTFHPADGRAHFSPRSDLYRQDRGFDP